MTNEQNMMWRTVDQDVDCTCENNSDLCSFCEAKEQEEEVVLKPNDEVLITQKFKTRATEEFKAVVTWIEDRGEFFYFGYVPESPDRGAWGCMRMYKDETTQPPYAATVLITGHRDRVPLHTSWTPKPRDKGYDSVH